MNTTQENLQGTSRKTAVLVGILFIIGTVSGLLAGLLAGLLTVPIQAGSTYPLNIIVSIFGPLHTAPLIESGIGQLMIPTAIQKMVFAVWLIGKGFNPAAIAALFAKVRVT